MNKKIIIPLIIVIALLIAGVAVLYVNLHKQQKENAEMEQLAALDKKEMENEYQQFANQYSEMKTQINNDSIVAQLTADVKSLVIHPYTTTHSQMSPEELAQQHITPSTIRLSIGTEHIDDIIDDLSHAFDKI